MFELVGDLLRVPIWWVCFYVQMKGLERERSSETISEFVLLLVIRGCKKLMFGRYLATIKNVTCGHVVHYVTQSSRVKRQATTQLLHWQCDLKLAPTLKSHLLVQLSPI